MLKTLDKCPLCHHHHFSHYITCEDYTVSHEHFDLVKCNQCRFVFTNPRPSKESLSKYYASEDYISHQNKSSNPINFIYKIARSFTIKSKVKLINQTGPRGTLLDIGCGTGHFIEALQASDWHIQGIEPDETARALAIERTKSNVLRDISQITNTRYNVITLWHVLEHVPDLNEFMHQVSTLLSQNGTIIVAVPNYQSYDAQIYKQHWAAYDVPRHLYHFDQETMSSLVAQYNLKITATLPMKLDAYYVSLLSEAYAGAGLKKYVSAFINGYKSNRYAKKNQNNYSSLIYLINK